MFQDEFFKPSGDIVFGFILPRLALISLQIIHHQLKVTVHQATASFGAKPVKFAEDQPRKLQEGLSGLILKDGQGLLQWGQVVAENVIVAETGRGILGMRHMGRQADYCSRAESRNVLSGTNDAFTLKIGNNLPMVMLMPLGTGDLPINAADMKHGGHGRNLIGELS